MNPNVLHGGTWWMLMVPDQDFNERIIYHVMDYHDMLFLTFVQNFSSLAWLEVHQEPSVLHVHTWRTLILPDLVLGGKVPLWCHGYLILDMCAKLHQKHWLPMSILWGPGRFLTRNLENRVILDIMDNHNLWFFTSVPIFSFLAWLEVCQEHQSLMFILGVYTTGSSLASWIILRDLPKYSLKVSYLYLLIWPSYEGVLHV